ncbi:MAG: serine/threonine-protein kinase [Planctomycetota bacterium]
MSEPLDVDRWRRVQELVGELEELDSAAREARLAALGDPPDVLRDVRRVLEDEPGPPESFLAPDVFAGALPATSPAPDVGARVGPFRLQRRIAAGGMGTVFEAAQDAPRRTVALKLLSVGLATDRARRRFEVEAEILGHLAHPGIAQVYGSGVHRDEAGLEVPWFAMELVPGARDVLRHAGEEALKPGERLGLFREICSAVEHGHGRGVLHRDLKPSNLLVDEAGRPRVIDFGVARATEADLSTTSELTGSGEILGTVQYMSPEQFEGVPGALDVRTDVYSLGVVLYELLCGAAPYALEGRSIFEAARVVREVAPRRPSEVDPALAGELEWILLRALEKEPERRYASVAALREDIERHLSNEPVLAGPPSALYRVRKFVRRHRVSVAAAAIVLAALVAGAGLAAFGLVRANENLARVEEEARRTGRVNRFLSDLFLAVAPVTGGREVRVADLLDQARETLRTDLEEDEAVRANLQGALAGAYFELGLFREAIELLEPALAFERGRLGPDAAPVLELEWKLEECRFNAGSFEGSEERMVALLARCTAELGESDPITMGCRSGLGELYWELGRLPDAIGVMREEVALRERFYPKDQRNLGRKRSFLSFLLSRLGEHEEAEALARRAYDDLREHLGDDDVSTLYARGNLAKIWTNSGRYGEASDVYRGLLDALEGPLGEEHPDFLTYSFELAQCEYFLHNYDEAERLGRKVLEIRERTIEPPHPELAADLLFLGKVLQLTGKLDEAELCLEDAYDQRLELFGEDYERTVRVRYTLASVRLDRGDYDGLEEELEAVIESGLAEGRPTRLAMSACSTLGRLHLIRKDDEAAERAFRRAADLGREGLPEDHPDQLDYFNYHARSLVTLKRDEEAGALLRELVPKLETRLDEEHPALRYARQSLAILRERSTEAAATSPEAAAEAEGTKP